MRSFEAQKTCLHAAKEGSHSSFILCDSYVFFGFQKHPKQQSCKVALTTVGCEKS